MTRLCSRCYAEDGRKVPTSAHSLDLCDSCLDRESERAHAAFVARFYGGSGPSQADEDVYRRDTGRGWR